jgi:demethylmenaquinone methyltransferase/2-methoxy-6-polyprenyl-1,4-benzoquinol methylase
MTDSVLRAQAEYYRRRAEEYDATAYGDLSAARERIARVLRRMQPTGSVIEIACGTGLWTEALAGVADSVLAIDVAPEALSIARGRARSANVMFESADIFSSTSTPRAVTRRPICRLRARSSNVGWRMAAPIAS